MPVFFFRELVSLCTVYSRPAPLNHHPNVRLILGVKTCKLITEIKQRKTKKTKI